MQALPTLLYTSTSVKDMDNIAISGQSEQAYKLMTRAGQAAFAALTARWPGAQKIAVFCGTGNNGGDGYVVARLALNAGMTVKVYQVGNIDPNKQSAAARQAQDAWKACQQPIVSPNSVDFAVDVIVDAVLGTGVRFPLKPADAQAITTINQARAQHRFGVLSIDLPSGLDGNAGNMLEVCIQADVTVTFIGLKVGLLTGSAYDYTGDLYFDDLGVDIAAEPTIQPIANRIDYEQAATWIATHDWHRQKIRHKRERGHVLVIGGGEIRYSGAPVLSAEAAYRAGAGLVTIGVPESVSPMMARALPEIMVAPIRGIEDAEPLIDQADVILIGPGLGQSSWSMQMLQSVLESGKPTVVDADALNILALTPKQQPHWILTPHPGEAGRLLQQSVQTVQANRLQSATALQQKYQGTIVLKGAGTVVACADDLPCIYGKSLPILATAGTGDVLAGLIAGLWAQGFSQTRSAQIGVVIHAQAAQQEALLGERGMIASDLFLHIRSLLSPLQDV